MTSTTIYFIIRSSYEHTILRVTGGLQKRMSLHFLHLYHFFAVSISESTDGVFFFLSFFFLSKLGGLAGLWNMLLFF
jgi:hypothetical protein